MLVMRLRRFSTQPNFVARPTTNHYTSSLYMCPLPITREPELVRDFIDDCLYHPSYGYFCRNQGPILPITRPITQILSSMKNQEEYNQYLKALYASANAAIGVSNELPPSWHTPSELFRPIYGHAIARFLLHRLLPQLPLVIYELGPGTGSLAEGILDFLQSEAPQVYSTCEYHLVDISPTLRRAQLQRLAAKHGGVLRNASGASLETMQDSRACWVVGCEVLDNMPHDCIKYDSATGELLEGIVLTNDSAPFSAVPSRNWLEFRPVRDRLLLELVNVLDAVGHVSPSLTGHSLGRALERYSPIPYLNPKGCEFVPTTAFKLLKTLTARFPRHSALFVDFHALPDRIPFGHNAPVVQTVYRGETVACSTFLLRRGYFDIFFSTNFALIGKIHGSLSPERRCTFTQRHGDFLRHHASVAEVGATSTKSGYNPMLHDFENVSVYVNEPIK